MNERETMIVRHMPLVAFVVRRMSSETGNGNGLDRDDAMGYGIEGLIQAVDNYDPDRIEYDREQLRKHYRNRGYFDFRVVSSMAELAPDKNGFAVTYTLDEGPKYKFGKITVQHYFVAAYQINLVLNMSHRNERFHGIRFSTSASVVL